MNEESSPVEHLARLGFEVASPLDPERWLSRDYWEETRRFGCAIRELLSLERVARRWKRVIEQVLAVRVARAVPSRQMAESLLPTTRVVAIRARSASE